MILWSLGKFNQNLCCSSRIWRRHGHHVCFFFSFNFRFIIFVHILRLRMNEAYTFRFVRFICSIPKAIAPTQITPKQISIVLQQFHNYQFCLSSILTLRCADVPCGTIREVFGSWHSLICQLIEKKWAKKRAIVFIRLFRTDWNFN